MARGAFMTKDKAVRRKTAAPVFKVVASMPRHTLAPWSCNHFAERSEIEAYVEGTGRREIIAEIKETAGVDAELVAGFIARAVNDYEKNQTLMRQMIAALEQCLTCNLSWEAEHEADILVRRAEEMVNNGR